MDACRRDGGTKLVKPAARNSSVSCSFPFLPPCLSLAGGEGGGDDDGDPGSFPARRNVTLDSNLFIMFDFSFSFSLSLASSTVACSLPFLPLATIVAKSSTGGGGDLALDLVAVRKLCSRDERMRLKPVV